MIRFQFPFGVEVYLDTSSPHETVPIRFEGDRQLVEMIRDRLTPLYGAYGHSIGSATTAIDLNHAMLYPTLARFSPELVAGAEIVQQHNLTIPSEAKT